MKSLKEKMTPHLLKAGIEQPQIERVFSENGKYEAQLNKFIKNEYAKLMDLWNDLTPEQWEAYEKMFGQTTMYEQKLLMKLRSDVRKAWKSIIKGNYA